MTSDSVLRIEAEHRGPVLVLAVSGHLGTGTVPDFARAVERAAANRSVPRARIVVDLSGVRTVDAAGARALAAAAGLNQVVLRALRPAPRRIVMAVCPELNLAGADVVTVSADGPGDLDPGSPTWTLVRKSRQARARARQAITDARRAAGLIAATEDRIATTLLLIAAQRHGVSDHVTALSQDARRNAERLRDRAGDVAAGRLSVAAAAGDKPDADTLRRAIAYIEDHARDPIAAADIAAAVNVSTRAVQLAFRRHLGVTPLGYLRQVRLERAHQELRAARPAPGIVTRIAADWRFTNLSRFSASYRAIYGVLPSQTLHEGEARAAGR